MLIDKSRRELRAAGLTQSNNRNGAVQALEGPGQLNPLSPLMESPKTTASTTES